MDSKAASPPDSYAGQRVLITGGTSGFGLATAVHVVNLGASEVIITAFSVKRGNAACQKIRNKLAAETQGRAGALELDMSRYGTVVGQVELLKKEYEGGLDCISQWPAYAEQEGGILDNWNNKANWQGATHAYSVSKLLVQYAGEKVAKPAVEADREWANPPLHSF